MPTLLGVVEPACKYCRRPPKPSSSCGACAGGGRRRCHSRPGRSCAWSGPAAVSARPGVSASLRVAEMTMRQRRHGECESFLRSPRRWRTAAGGRAPRRVRAWGHRDADWGAGRARCAPAVSRCRLFVALHVLHPGAAPVGACCIRADRSGARRAAVSRHHRWGGRQPGAGVLPSSRRTSQGSVGIRSSGASASALGASPTGLARPHSRPTCAGSPMRTSRSISSAPPPCSTTR